MGCACMEGSFRITDARGMLREQGAA